MLLAPMPLLPLRHITTSLKEFRIYLTSSSPLKVLRSPRTVSYQRIRCQSSHRSFYGSISDPTMAPQLEPFFKQLLFG
ncbi:hypothetical protein BO71DRAFT_210100 [Aspergillus ellipticus CBS 707.79]|uniref:Uncharacterized protein n=1 Tax=Aspergillus ellipticus CBS 707.79 TaxID=1448320 RepID=A0A319DCU2_9EURO|nr:hypothetical protein BO71DRAFT_210100 [Aspergillus ellipticus CBS 707.79]